MKLGLEEKKDDPLILNLFQTGEYSDNYLMGKLIPEEELDSGNNPEPAGDSRQKYQWRPIDAVTEEQVDEKQKSFPLKDDVIRIDAGEVSPRKIYILLPDKFSEVANDLKRGFGDRDPKTALGLVLAKFYESRQIIHALRTAANNEPEIMEKVGFAISNSELDDAVKEKFAEKFETNLKRMDQIESGSVEETI